jgi:mRNA interferase MazF
MGQRRELRQIKRFEVYWVALDPIVGFEMQKTRPCVVITPNFMNEMLGTVVIAPMTTNFRALPFRVKVILGGKKGEIALDQMRAVDKLRLGKAIATLDNEAAQDIIQKLQEMFAE